MSKIFFTKLKYFYFLLFFFFFIINSVFAQTGTSIPQTARIDSASTQTKTTSTTKNTDYMSITNSSISSVGKLIQNVNNNIAANLVILLSSVAFVLFLWGLVRFIFDRANGKDDALEKDKKAMGWGLAALFVLISVWGIIKMFQGFLGIQGSGDINLPKICVNGSCDKVSGAVSPVGAIKSGGDFSSSTDKLNITNKVDGTYDAESIRMWNLPLEEGMTGNSVETAQLQQFLKDHNYASYLGITGPNQDGVDGIFGPNTTAAVKAFQKDNALAQDGIIGFGTKAVILYRYVTKPTNDTYQVLSWPDIMTSNQSTNSNTNGAVSELQTFLQSQGYALGATGPNNDGIDGIYGGMTSKAILDFQAKYYLKEDNLVGPSTKAVIEFVENGNN